MKSNLVSAEWLQNHLNDENLIILDATISKVSSNQKEVEAKQIIQNALFFDLKHKFSDLEVSFPNTIPNESQFQDEAQLLGINQDSKIVVYDDLGIYSSPRVWWLFKTFGFDNVFVLNGGLPEWIRLGYKTVSTFKLITNKGNFIANFQPNKITYINNIKLISNDKNVSIIDARSSARFNSEISEPRKDLRRGKIPNSLNLPFEMVLDNGLFQPKEKLLQIFKEITQNSDLVFTCGSGITACILDLAANEAGIIKTKVYDGSWTEYGTLIKA